MGSDKGEILGGLISEEGLLCNDKLDVLTSLIDLLLSDEVLRCKDKVVGLISTPALISAEELLCNDKVVGRISTSGSFWEETDVAVSF